jgi:hypothetical protein
MRNFFKRQSLPPIEDLFSALLSANEYLHPEWDKEELLFNSAHLARNCKNHKQLTKEIAGICKLALDKQGEVLQLNNQLQLTTDINN